MNAPTRVTPGRPRGVRREQLSDEVAARLRAEIMSGFLRPGTFIRLDETAGRLGVSIPPVREALRTLRGEGMVEFEPHRGHTVSAFTRSDIEDIFWLQTTIATELARSAAERISDAEIAELEVLNEQFALAVQGGDPDEVEEAEFAFHRVLNRAAGRMKLARFLLHAARNLPPQVYVKDPQWGGQTVAEHRRLIEALRRRDADAVVVAVGKEFADGKRRLTARLDEVGVWGRG